MVGWLSDKLMMAVLSESTATPGTAAERQLRVEEAAAAAADSEHKLPPFSPMSPYAGADSK
jgi:hypothetical protein